MNHIDSVDGKEMPPEKDGRTFNQLDILGSVMDDNGDIMLAFNSDGFKVDKDGKEVNDRGYLVNKTGDVIDVKASLIMFTKSALDQEGEIPSPH
jgi:hypothetical protein